MQKKIIMIHVMVCALCAAITNISHAKIEEIRPIKLVCDGDSESRGVDDDGITITPEYKVIAAGQEGKILTLTTKEIRIKDVIRKLDDYKNDPRVVVYCTKDHNIFNNMTPFKTVPTPILTCPKGSSIEGYFELTELPEGFKHSDFTYHAELKIESDDKDNVETQKITDDQQQTKQSLKITNSIPSVLPNSQLTSGNGLHW